MTPNWTNGLSEAFNRKFTFAFSALALYASGLGLSLLALALAYWPCFTGLGFACPPLSFEQELSSVEALGLGLPALALAYWPWHWC